MENYSYNSHPNSRDSSPRSRELMDNDNPSSFDELPPPSNTYRVKLMCSYGGKIQPRPHDNQLTYVGGDTKILAVDRNAKLSVVMAKLSALANSDVCFKYQLPGEDLDALISVTNEEDLDHMMVEYDRLCRASPKPARLRLFLFPINNNNNNNNNASSVSSMMNLAATDSKPERQWFVDALNSVQVQVSVPIPPLECSSPQPKSQNPDFLFGFDNAYSAVPATKQADSQSAILEFPAKSSAAGSECGSETVRETEIQEMQKLQFGNNEQQQKNDEETSRIYGGENGRIYGGTTDGYGYSQTNSENVLPLATHEPARVYSGPNPVQVSGPIPVPVHSSFLPERHNGYPLGVSANGTEQTPVYLIQTQSGIFQAVRPVTGPVGQPVYFIQTPHSQMAHKVAYNGSEAGGVVPERGYSHVSYLPDRSALQRPAAAAPGGDGWN